MSLGLFNCRLIQPAGDQLFFFVGCLAAPLPVRASSVQSPCDPSCSAPTNGRAQNASCLSFSESSCFGFRRGRSPVGCRRVNSHRLTREFPRRSPILPTDSAIEPEILRYCRLSAAIASFNGGIRTTGLGILPQTLIHSRTAGSRYLMATVGFTLNW